MTTLRIFIDGACRGNPGPGSIGVVVADDKGKILKRHGRSLGPCTNNVAEFAALSEALDLARGLGGRKLKVFSDSELLVRQFNGIYRVRNERLKTFLEKIRGQAGAFDSVELAHVPREDNREADRLANEALDNAGPVR